MTSTLSELSKHADSHDRLPRVYIPVPEPAAILLMLLAMTFLVRICLLSKQTTPAV